MIQTQDYLREFVTILFIRKKIVVITTLLFIIGALLLAFLWPPIYAADGSILMKRNEVLTSPESIEDVNPEITSVSEDDLFSELELLNSNTVAENTARTLLEDYPYFSEKYGSEKGEDKLASEIKQNLSTDLVPKSNVLSASITWSDDERARQILEVYFREYLNYRAELYNPKAALSFFQEQINRFKQELQKRENKLIEMAEKGNVSDPSEQIKSNLQVQKNLAQELSNLQNELQQKQAYVNHLQNSLKSRDFSFFTSVDDMEIGDYGKDLQSLIQEKRDLLKDYTLKSTKVHNITEQIDETFVSLKGEVQRYLDAQKAKIEGLKDSIAGTKSRINKLEKRNVELYKNMVKRGNLNREIDLLDESYSTFGKRLEEANIKTNTRADTMFNVGILSKPQATNGPVFPKKTQTLGLGVILGIIVGVTLGFLFEFFDHTFKRPEDVYNYTDLPHICSLPKW